MKMKTKNHQEKAKKGTGIKISKQTINQTYGIISTNEN